MEIIIKRVTDWERVANAARMTVHKGALGKEPSETFKRKIISAEHSPIRLLEFDVIIKGIPQFICGHLVRHTQGIEKFVATSREDRTGVPREERRQTDLVDCQFSLNAQAFINISRKRLCRQADPDTIKVWQEVISALYEVEPILAEFCVPECIYRGFCPEIKSCGVADAPTHQYKVLFYRTLRTLPEEYRLNTNVMNGIAKGLVRTGGECPCHNEGATREDRMCPCKKFREEGICCCNLYVQEK